MHFYPNTLIDCLMSNSTSFKIILDEQVAKDCRVLIVADGVLASGNSRFRIYSYNVVEIMVVIFSCSIHNKTIGISSIAYTKLGLLSKRQQPIGCVERYVSDEHDERELWGLRDKKPEPSRLYQLDERTIICICSLSLCSENFHIFASTVCIFKYMQFIVK